MRAELLSIYVGVGAEMQAVLDALGFNYENDDKPDGNTAHRDGRKCICLSYIGRLHV